MSEYKITPEQVGKLKARFCNLMREKNVERALGVHSVLREIIGSGVCYEIYDKSSYYKIKGGLEKYNFVFSDIKKSVGRVIVEGDRMNEDGDKVKELCLKILCDLK